MIAFSFDLRGARAATGRFEELTARVMERIAPYIEETGEFAVEALKATAPRDETSLTPGSTIADRIHQNPLQLYGSTMTLSVSIPSEARFTIPPGVPAHKIEMTDKVLHFFWAAIGEEVFFHSVNHPGYHPTDDWIADTIDNIRADMIRRLNRVTSQVIIGPNYLDVD